MGFFKKALRPSFVGTLSDKMYDEVSPLTSIKQLNSKRVDSKTFERELTNEFGRESHQLFLYTVAKFKTSPYNFYKKYHRLRRLMRYFLVFTAIMFALAINECIDVAIGSSTIVSMGIYILCSLLTLAQYAVLSHKAKQIAIGAIFPKYRMLSLKNHMNFEAGLYSFTGKLILSPIIYTDEMYKAAITEIKNHE